MTDRHRAWVLTLTVVTSTFAPLAQPTEAVAQDTRPPTHVRAMIEGTWRLVEWHSGGEVVRSPDMEGLWMVYDGHVMATRHRNGQDGHESTAGYGRYRWGPTTWTYGYERSEDRRGPSVDEAPLRVTAIPDRVFEITRNGDHLILEDAAQTLRWDYDITNNTFLLMGRDQRVIRKYRRVE